MSDQASVVFPLPQSLSFFPANFDSAIDISTKVTDVLQTCYYNLGHVDSEAEENESKKKHNIIE